MEKPELTFEQFTKMCEDAGIAAKPEEMEQDYRTGAVLADVVDSLMDAMESTPAIASADDGVDAIEGAVDALGRELEGTHTPESLRQRVIHIATLAIRFAADVCHDEAGNN